MTLIENDSPKVQYTGPFVKGQLLPLTFPYIEKENIKMIIDGVAGEFNKDFEIGTDAASVRLKKDLPNAKQITIYRSTPLDQQAPFPQMSKFRSERIELALDKLTMQQQEQEEQLSRCVIAPITLETFNGQLPAPAANQALKWNKKGTELENYDIIGEQEAFENDVNTRFAEQSTAFENRVSEFEDNTNAQFAGFRAEISEDLESVLEAADKLENLDNSVQAAKNAASQAEEALTEVKEVTRNAKYLSRNQIANCILEIPQNIRYTFENGTFTLLKGSIMIFPHGTTNLSSTYPAGSNYRNTSLKVVDTQFADNKFFVRAEIQKDVVLNKAGDVTGTNNFFFVDSNNATIAWYGMPSIHSGETVPTSGQCWYDTTNNVINTTSNSFATYINNNFSLPICTFAREAGAITSINQVFNGFGYIGSTIWVDKGVKALIPNDRNTDGTLKNTECVTSKIKLAIRDIPDIGTWHLALNESGNLYDWNYYKVVKTYNDVTTNTCLHYVIDDNKMYYRSSKGVISVTYACYAGTFYNSEANKAGKVTDLDINHPFRVVDYNEFNTKVDVIESTLDTKVNKAGDTMTGDLTINRNGGHFRISGTGWKGLASSNPDADITATDQTDKQGTRLISYDKNGAIMGYLQTFIDKNGNIATGMNAQRVINGETLQASINIGVDNQGNKFTNAITPPEDNKSIKIATTEWVRKQASKDSFPSTKSVTLTLGATLSDDGINIYESEHVAPANGWFWLLWECNGSNDYVQMRNKNNIYRFQVPHRGETGYYSFMLPFKKGEVCRITYQQAPRSSNLRFFYSEGNQ